MPGRVQISAVHDEAPRHERLGALPIQIAKNIPLRADKRGVGSAQCFVGVFVVGHLREEGLGSRYSFRIGGVYNRAFLEQALNDLKRRSKTNVVRVGLKRKPKNRHVLAFNDPESLVYFLKKTIDALIVDALSRFQ